MTTQQRLALQAKADDLQAEITKLRAELAAEKEKPWEPWKPGVAQSYWVLNAQGVAFDSEWVDDQTDHARRDFNNCRPTKESAERHALRLRSMRPTCPVPKVGEEVWVALCWERGFRAEVWICSEGATLGSAYLLGRVFTTKEACEAWIAEYGDAWTTLENGCMKEVTNE